MTPAEFRTQMRPLVMAAHRLKKDAPVDRVLDKIEKKVYACQSHANDRAKKAADKSGHPEDYRPLARDDVRQAFLLDYGRPCPFTGESMRASNTELDHIDPLFSGGENTARNIRLLSTRANKIKENMSNAATHILFEALLQMDADSQASVTRRLMSKPKWR